MQVAVCGPGQATPAEVAHARRVGELLAGRGVTVLCGAGGGVMAAVAVGARSRGGLVIGVRPDDGTDPGPAELSAHLVTNMGQARNAILVWSADAVIAVGGSWGTLSEVALAMRRGGIPVVVLGGWRIVDAHGSPVPGPVHVDTPEEAVRVALGEPG
ncbi:dethiobiotin synthetase [Micromonospora sp. NPDC005806]|uniref:SLOG cluster 4 domain-containing protein n=1 Tax=Micromonospora sp. NPDC005806 TaxID=3364234 RepID=UPI003682F2D7